MPLDVIGCGCGRTGTQSVQKALDQLGVPCYHMFKLLDNQHGGQWCEIEDKMREQDLHSLPERFKEIFENGKEPYRATMDWPASLYYKELMKVRSHAACAASA
jgi:Sulfotransferase domain